MATSQATPAAALRIQRTFAAPREKVFKAWTDPRALIEWWGPEGYATPSAEVDLRPGGKYRLGMKKLPDGDVFFLSGIFQEVRPPEKLVYTWRWENQAEFPDTRVTVEFLERAGSTEIVLVHELLPNEKARDEHGKGWNGCLDRLGVISRPISLRVLLKLGRARPLKSQWGTSKTSNGGNTNMKRMVTRGIIMSALVFTLGLGAAQAGTAGFDQLKTLVGDWEGKGPDGGTATVSYRLTSGGSALVETLKPGNGEEMVTIYHADGNSLAMTHYCMLNNQPRMRANDASGKEIHFKQVDITNLPDPAAPHMSQLALVMEDADHLTHNWTMSQGGENEVHTFRFTRKK